MRTIYELAHVARELSDALHAADGCPDVSYAFAAAHAKTCADALEEEHASMPARAARRIAHEQLEIDARAREAVAEAAVTANSLASRAPESGLGAVRDLVIP